jgi:predicted DNA-binding protein with PD1-like motif
MTTSAIYYYRAREALRDFRAARDTAAERRLHAEWAREAGNTPGGHVLDGKAERGEVHALECVLRAIRWREAARLEMRHERAMASVGVAA